MALNRPFLGLRRAVKPALPDPLEKIAFIEACEALIRDHWRPRRLANIVPTRFNYCVDVLGVYAGGRYRFLQRYRSGYPENLGAEFDSPFARIDRVGKNKFDLYWMRANERWWPLHANLTLAEAIETLRTDELLQPL